MASARGFLFAALLLPTCFSFDGDECYDKTWAVGGTCGNLSSCEFSEQLLAGNREPQICGFELGSKEPSVCCPFRVPPPVFIPEKGKACYHKAWQIRGTCMPAVDCPSAGLESSYGVENQRCAVPGEMCCSPTDYYCDTQPGTGEDCDCAVINFTLQDTGKPRSVAESKCAEYSGFVCPDPIWFRSNDSFTAQFNNFCPRRHRKTKLDVIDVINPDGGSSPIVEKITPNATDYPHMALLGVGLREQIAFICSGSLIAPDVILTAAHCGQPKWALLGTLDRRDATAKPTPQQLSPEFPTYPQLLEVQEVIPHPEYSSTVGYNDIALLRLKEPAQMTATVRPACLNTAGNELGKWVTGAGWGDTSGGVELPSEMLIEADLKLQPLDDCSGLVGGVNLPLGLVESQLCARGDGEQDSCPGDSGGPLMVRKAYSEVYCMHSILGVSSFGSPICSKGSPSVYTRVSFFVPWIESIVWPQG